MKKIEKIFKKSLDGEQKRLFKLLKSAKDCIEHRDRASLYVDEDMYNELRGEFIELLSPIQFELYLEFVEEEVDCSPQKKEEANESLEFLLKLDKYDFQNPAMWQLIKMNLIEVMKNGTLDLYYTKKDGSSRLIQATIEMEDDYVSSDKKLAENVIYIKDIEDNKWKMIYINKISSISVLPF